MRAGTFTILALVTVASWSGTVCGSASESSESPATMTVTGTANLKVPADQFSISLGVTTAGASLAKAQRDATGRYQEIEAALKSLGLTPVSDFSTDRFSVDVQWSTPPKGGSNQPRTIVGYRVSAGVEVHTSRLDLAGTVIEKAVEAGANNIGSPRFSLADPADRRREAIALAAKNAVADATVLAQSTRTSITGIRQMSIDNASLQPVTTPRPRMMRAEAKSLAVTPSTITVTADVTIVYGIRSPNAADAAELE